MKRFVLGSFLGLAVAAVLCAFFTARAGEAPPSKPYQPKVVAASDEGVQAIKRFRLPQDLKADLFAAEPLLANPVSFCFDEKGRVYVAETFRLHKGVTDNRKHMNWLKDDLASRIVADRVAMYKKYLGAEYASYGIEHERIRRIEVDAEGKAVRSTVFADGFNRPADGLGAGVLARGGNVWYTCIPDLYLLQDTKGTGKADVKKSLHSGYGVHVAYLGHDMHGLRFGPDGKLYFSIGDRGLNVTTAGRTVASIDTGAVLRCNPDGSELEIVATGLRNPQELAFDKHGNLFTCDNNSDSGDAARCVYIVEGGDSGWRIGYQYMTGPTTTRGPWNAEQLWHLEKPGDAAYRLPPLAHIANGPSGLTYNPGVTLLPERYRDHFFLCDFKGGSGLSGIHSFALKPRGATFEMVDRAKLVWSVLVTDCDFGPDGGLYLSDWVDGWNTTGKGRLYKIHAPGRDRDPAVAEVKKLLAEGFGGRPIPELVKLLEHADMRVRQEAQFALVDRGAAAVKPLQAVADKGKDQLARLHALWGLGQLARQKVFAVPSLSPLLQDADAEVRAQAAKVLANDHDPKQPGAVDKLIPLLKDAEPRVRFFAALSLGKLGQPAAVAPIVEMLRDNADKDAYLRHAGVMALAGIQDTKALQSAAQDASPSVRLAALLAMRRLQMPEIARFLNDAEPRLVLEAARAINDVPIHAALPQLAALAPRTKLAEPVLFRVVNAHFRLGGKENAVALAALAARKDVPAPVRLEALKALGDWAEPSSLDRVVGLSRPLPKRPVEDAAEGLRPALAGIFTAPDKVRAEGVRLAAKLGIKEAGPALLELVADSTRSPQVRVETLRALATLEDRRLPEAIKLALADGDPHLRAEGRHVLAALEPERGLAELEKALQKGAVSERQSALATLGEMKLPAADVLLSRWLDRLLAGEVEPEVRLDLLEAAARRSSKEIKKKLARYEAARSPKDNLAKYRESLAGGDAEAGRRLFLERAELSCVRCHKVNGVGGEVGPDLTGIGKREKREYLLDSIVAPDHQIAKGYDTVVLSLTNGQVKMGILKSEDAKQVQLMTAEGVLVTVPTADIEERTRGKSSMPDDLLRYLSRSDLRDLVEFLNSLQ